MDRPTPQFVRSPRDVAYVTDHLTMVKEFTDSTLIFYVDLEGVKLSRYGSISILTLLVQFGPMEVYLFDVHNLGFAAFETVGLRGTSMKDFL